MNKRGISPLIASVLMIAFAVTLFLIISSFVRQEVVDTSLERGGEQIASTLDCLNSKVKVISATKSGETSVTYSVDNLGSGALKSIKVRILGTDGSFTDTQCDDIQALDRCTKTASGLSIGTIKSVEAVPELDSGLCASAGNSKKIA
jgi:flagellin-like protein